MARKNDDDDDETDALSLPLMLSDNRRADLSVFKGKQLVNIREYYEVGLLPCLRKRRACRL